ncbi:MAG: very short patch repair endonuclease [Phycisphaerae bacterium]
MHPWLHSATPSGSKSATPAQRRACMQPVKSRDTGPERIVRSVLHRLGCRFSHAPVGLAGSPDVVMRARRTVVFVHGCFWHGHGCARGRREPVTNAAYWQAKIARNRARDKQVRLVLSRDKWRVFVVWECQTRDRDALTERLSTLIRG